MGRIVVTELISHDGVIEAPGGGEDYKYAGWTFEIDRGDEGNRFKLGETKHSAALLLGQPCVMISGIPRPWRAC
jgi:hypothetical protein